MTDALLSDADVGLSPPAGAPNSDNSGLLSDADVGLAGASAPQADSLNSTIAAPAIGFNRGLADVAGAPVDAMNWAMGKLGVPVSQTPFGGSASIKQGLGLIGANPDQPNLAPQSRLESALQAGGEGAASMMAPEAALAGAGAAGVEMAPAVGQALESTFGSAASPAAVIKNAAIGASAGTAGEAASQQFDPAQHPYWAAGARLAGNLVGGGLTAAATDINPWNMVKSFKAPLTEEGQAQIAGQQLRDAATSPTAAIDTIENTPQQIVPGSNPTTFQLTGDMGLGALERRVQTQNPAPFNDVRAGQNQARVDALNNIQATGSPEDVSAALRTKLNALSAQADADVGDATTTAQQQVGALGGDQSPGFYGEQIRGHVQPQVDLATQNAAAATNALGGTGTPEGYGAALRDPLVAAKQSAQQARSALYKAVDPTGSLNVVATTLRDAGDAAAAKLSPLAEPPMGAEAGIMNTIQSLPDVVPFNDLQALDARVTAAMTAERRTAGETPVWGRLSQMKGAVQDAIDNGVANQVAYERSQVATGAMAPENTIEARSQQWTADLERSRDAFIANKIAGAGNLGTAYAPTGTRSVAGPGVSGTAGQNGSGLGNDAGAQGLPPPPIPNFDPAAAERLTTAKQAHAQYAQTYRQGPVGAALKTNGFPDQFRMPSAAVPDAVFAKGAKGFESGMAYRNAVQDDPAAISAAHNYAAMTLRRVAERPDGTIDPGRFSSWKAAYGDALRAFPGLSQKFSTAAKASEELGKFAPFRADMAPYNVPEVFFHSGVGGKEGVDNLRRLVGDHHAQAILQDYAASKLKSTAMRQDGTLDPAKVARFQQAHAEALQSFPALNAKFSTAAKASDAIDEAATARKKTLDAFQAGSIGKVMNAAPEDVTKHIGAIFGQKDASATMARLASQAQSGGPDAVAGLRKAIADHITSKFVSNTEAGTSGTNLVKSDQFQTFMKANKPALSKVFSPEEIASMDAIAADLHRANRTITAVKIPGSPGTAQDRTAVEGAARKPEGSLLNAMIGGGWLGHETGGLFGAMAGAAGGVIKHVVGSKRSAGYGRVEELVRDAMLDPDLAAQLLKKAPVVAGPQDGVSLGQKLMRLGVYSAANQVQGRAAGGRVATAEPTEMQKAVGNYKKHHMRVHGLDVTIENPKGSYRSGVGPDGKAWRVKMPNDYGYVRGTVGADGDHVDCYVGPHDRSDKVFVVDQKDLKSGKFDEHKIMFGFRNREAAIGGYCNGFSDGKGSRRIMKITPMSVDEFKTWLASGNTKEPTAKAA